MALPATRSPRVFPTDTRARPETRHSLDSSEGVLTIPGATTGSKAWTNILCRRKLLPLLAQRGHIGVVRIQPLGGRDLPTWPR